MSFPIESGKIAVGVNNPPLFVGRGPSQGHRFAAEITSNQAGFGFVRHGPGWV